jgi:hypothetical protein
MHAESSRHFRRRCLTLLLLAAALAGWVSTADAQRSLTPKGKAIAGRSAGDEFCVGTKVYGRTSPSTVALKDGGFVVFWSYFDSSGQVTPTSIRGQRYDAAGNHVDGEFIVRELPGPVDIYHPPPSTPFGAGLSDGGFVVTWDEGYGRADHIYGQRYDSAGAKVGSAFRIDHFDTDSGRVAQGRSNSGVAALKNGGFVVVWTIGSHPSGVPGPRDYDVFARRYNANGRPLGKNFRAHAVSQKYQFNASVAGLNNGGFVITWQSRDAGFTTAGVYGQRYAITSVPLGGEFKINSQSTSIAWSAVAAINDGFVVVWGDVKSQDTVDTDLYGRRYNLAGQPIGGLIQIPDAREAAVSGLSDGGFVFTWSDKDGSGISGRRYDASSAPIGPAFRVTTGAFRSQRYSSATGLKDGGFAVTWRTDWGSNHDLCGRVYSP